MSESEATSASKPSGEGGSPAAAFGKSEFLEKVADIPVVKEAAGYGTAAYNHVKQMNRLTSFTLNKAESTVLYLALTAKPFLEKLQPQAKAVDQLACRSLETLEAKVPFITKSPDELVEEARRLCSTTLDTGKQKVGEIKSMGTGALSSAKNYGLQKASDCLAGTEDLVERYLPPAFGESSKDPSEGRSPSISERATQLTTKVGQRVYGHGVKHFLTVQKMSQESISKLLFTVELIQHIKENYAGKSVQECIDDAKVKATWIWNELNKEPADDAEQADKSLEKRLLSLARRLTSTLVHTYASTTVLTTELPQTCLDGVNSARAYAVDLFTQFDQATNAGEVATNILQTTRATISALEDIVKNMVTTVQAKEIEMVDLSDKEKPEESSDANS